MILVITNQDNNVDGGPYYEGHIYAFPVARYLKYRHTKLFTRILAKCCTSKGRIYWRTASNFKLGAPCSLPLGHKVLETWSNPYAYGNSNDIIKDPAKVTETLARNAHKRLSCRERWAKLIEAFNMPKEEV